MLACTKHQSCPTWTALSRLSLSLLEVTLKYTCACIKALESFHSSLPATLRPPVQAVSSRRTGVFIIYSLSYSGREHVLPLDCHYTVWCPSFCTHQEHFPLLVSLSTPSFSRVFWLNSPLHSLCILSAIELCSTSFILR